MAGKEIAILGAGVAGLSAAAELEKEGNQVTILTPEQQGIDYRSVYTTFQGETKPFKDLFPDHTLRPLTGFKFLTDNSSLSLDGRGYWMLDYPEALNALKSRLHRVKIEELLVSNSHISIMDTEYGACVSIDGEKRYYDAVIDCSGEKAVTKSGKDPVVEFVYGGVYQGGLKKQEMIIAFIDSIGATCWVNPSILGDGYIDVVVSAWGWKSQSSRFMQEGPRRLRILRDFMREMKAATFLNSEPETIFSGTIRSQIMDRPEDKNIYTAGDAAGMARPKTGDGFRWAIYGGQLAANAINEGDSPKDVYRQFTKVRPAWKDKLLQGATLYRLNKQRLGNLGTSVKPIAEIIEKHPQFKGMAEDFFINDGIDPRFLVYMLAKPHFRKILVNSVLTQFNILMNGMENIPHEYPFPELE